MRPHIAPLGDHQKAVAQVLLGRLKRLGLLGPPKARERESKEERRNAKKIMGISLRMQRKLLRVRVPLTRMPKTSPLVAVQPLGVESATGP